MTSRPIALTIAGFDPSSGAGVTADLKVFAAFGMYGIATISSLTVQSTLGVRASHPVSGVVLRETLDCLTADTFPSGIKIGMLASLENVRQVASYLSEIRAIAPRIPVVLDPVARSSSGAELLSNEALAALKEELLPQVDWVTPNLEELAALTGRPVREPDQISPAAQALIKDVPGALSLVVTGGHLERPDDYLLTASGKEQWFPGEWVKTSSTHGTGCAFSSALLCGLIRGLAAEAAVLEAKHYVTEALKAAFPVGKGKGPMHHLYRLG